MHCAQLAQSPGPLTRAQRRVLCLACAQGIAPRDVGGAVRDATVTSLEARGLIALRTNRKGRTLWRATDAGCRVVASVGLVPTFLHRHVAYGYTHTLARAAWREPEVIL